jgi:hypothetical protein
MVLVVVEVVMASLIGELVNDVGTRSKNTSPDSNKIHSTI